MSGKVLRTFPLGGRWTAAGLRAEERGLPHARDCLLVASAPPSARGLRPGAPGIDASAEERRLVTTEMRGFAASISAVREVRGCIGRGVA